MSTEPSACVIPLVTILTAAFMFLPVIRRSFQSVYHFSSLVFIFLSLVAAVVLFSAAHAAASLLMCRSLCPDESFLISRNSLLDRFSSCSNSGRVNR
jgi:hypothetical protein